MTPELRSKTRHQFYLPDGLSAKLDALAGQPGSSKTAILSDALAAWLERRAGHELDERFGARLDRQSRASDRIEQKLDYLIETLGLSVLYQLMLTAHQPAFDDEARRVGRLRYDHFMKQVGQRLSRAGPELSSVAVNPGKGDRQMKEPLTDNREGPESASESRLEPITVRITEACRLTGIGRSKLYELIKTGEITTIEVGAITLVPIAVLKEFIRGRSTNAR